MFGKNILKYLIRYLTKYNKQYGSLQKHRYADNLLKKYQEQTREHPNLQIEAKFKNGERWEKGMGSKNFVKADIRDSKTGVVYLYEFNALDARELEIAYYQKHVPQTNDKIAEIVIVRPTESAS